MSTEAGAGIGGTDPNSEDPRADLIWGTIPALVTDAAHRFGDTEALVDGDVALSYCDLADEVDRYARGFMALGVEPGERIAMWAPNCAPWMLAALGALRAGAVLVPMNTRFKGTEASYVLRTSGATTLVTVRGFLGVDYPALLEGEDVGALRTTVLLRDEGGDESPSLIDIEAFLVLGDIVLLSESAARAEAIRPEDISDLIFTSGTTGYPKGAATTHAQSLRTFGTWASIVGLTHGDRYLVVNPFFHTFGYKAGILASLMAGATVVPEAVFDPASVMARIPAERISVLPGPPTLYQSLLADPNRAVRPLVASPRGHRGRGGAVELVHAMRHSSDFNRAHRLRPHRVLWHRHHVPPPRSARDHRPDLGAGHPRARSRRHGRRRDRGCGEPGEIVVRGYTVMSGYWNDEAATASTIDADGWLHTGDIGVMDQSGNVTITDRLKDMFMVGGFNAYPAEIEAMLRSVPGVAQIAVVGVPDERMGEVGSRMWWPPRTPTSAATHWPKQSCNGPGSTWPTTRCRARSSWSRHSR